MKEQFSTEELNKALFMNLVLMFGSSAMQQMGKLANPFTGKVEEPTMEAAQQTIDLIAMLEAKTKNNLDREEARLLKDTLASLQMTFVDTQATLPAKGAKEEKTVPRAAESSGATAAENETPPSPPAGNQDGKDPSPKYHKSYGEK